MYKKLSNSESRKEVLDHFVDVNKMVHIGSGTQREIDDYPTDCSHVMASGFIFFAECYLTGASILNGKCPVAEYPGLQQETFDNLSTV